MIDHLRAAVEAEQRRVDYMRRRHPRLSLEDPTEEFIALRARMVFWFAASIGMRRHDLKWSVVIDGGRK